MNNKQNQALASLSRAFARCKKANLGFVGMDNNLIVYDADELDAIFEKGCVCDEQYKAAGDRNQGETVDTHGCYRDSGGW